MGPDDVGMSYPFVILRSKLAEKNRWILHTEPESNFTLGHWRSYK